MLHRQPHNTQNGITGTKEGDDDKMTKQTIKVVLEFKTAEKAKLVFDNLKKVMSVHGDVGIDKVTMGETMFTKEQVAPKNNEKCKCINCGRKYETRNNGKRQETRRPEYFG